MTQADLAVPEPPANLRSVPAGRLVRQFAWGFGYWVFFLLVLEPDNVLRALQQGHGLGWGREALRITGAGLLGAAATPVVLAAVRLWPIEGRSRWPNAAALAGACLGLAAGLIVLSCLLAPLLLRDERRPLARALVEELVSNGPLLVFCIAGLMALGHAVRFFGRATRPVAPIAADPAVPVAWITRVTVKTRSGVELLDLDRVDWIESQGNYLALRAGAATWLVRETSANLEARLDPARFARIHRRTLVAVDRIRAVSPRGAGDATVRLADGTELRLSRTYRDRIAALLDGP